MSDSGYKADVGEGVALSGCKDRAGEKGAATHRTQPTRVNSLTLLTAFSVNSYRYNSVGHWPTDAGGRIYCNIFNFDNIFLGTI